MLGAASLSARESLGIFGSWGAFSDAREERCYAIGQGEPDPRQRERQPFMTVGTWPKAGVRGEVYWQLARTPLPFAVVTAQAAGKSFRLRTAGANAWAQDAGMDAAIRAAMRSAQTLTVFYRDAKGRRFYDRYRLAGAPTAVDAATLACAQSAQLRSGSRSLP
jgi:hypothetical protein